MGCAKLSMPFRHGMYCIMLIARLLVSTDAGEEIAWLDVGLSSVWFHLKRTRSITEVEVLYRNVEYIKRPWSLSLLWSAIRLESQAFSESFVKPGVGGIETKTN